MTLRDQIHTHTPDDTRFSGIISAKNNNLSFISDLFVVNYTWTLILPDTNVIAKTVIILSLTGVDGCDAVNGKCCYKIAKE